MPPEERKAWFMKRREESGGTAGQGGFGGQAGPANREAGK